jgi:peptidyl-prolyl cis-trans isomerase B (cyclophilin B)
MDQRVTAKRILLARLSGLVAAAIIVVLLVILNSRIASRTGADRPPRHHHAHEHAAEAPVAGAMDPEEKQRIAAEYRDKLAVIETDLGTVKLELYPEDAPRTVDNFATLARKGFYDGLSFHRIAKGALIQGGSPDGSPGGGPGYTIPAEFNRRMHVEGTVGMARAADPDSAGSQFYICLKQLPQLDSKYTVFGHVVEGMDVVRKIAQSETDSDDRPLEPISMQDVSIEGPP